MLLRLNIIVYYMYGLKIRTKSKEKNTELNIKIYILQHVHLFNRLKREKKNISPPLAHRYRYTFF